MPDPLSHLCIAWLVGRAAWLRRWLVVFLIGTFLPDFLTSAPTVMVGGYWFWAVAHTPVGAVLWAYAISLLFREAERRSAFLCLVTGGWLAIGLDVLQDHISGGYMLFFPFSWREFELHLIHPEGSLDWLPWLVAGVILVELARALHRRLPRNAA